MKIEIVVKFEIQKNVFSNLLKQKSSKMSKLAYLIFPLYISLEI
jgi:hypothetical protein